MNKLLIYAIIFLAVESSGSLYAQGNNHKWIGNHLGDSDIVLAPWTPMKLEKKAANYIQIECWNRQYIFRGTAYPSQIESDGNALLARPISLIVVTNDGKSVEWGGTEISVIDSSPTHVDIETITRATNIPGVRQIVRFHVEYDGLMVMNMRLTLPPNLRSVYFQIPVLANVAKYEHRWQSKFYGRNLTLSGKQGIIDSSAFLPFSWVGNNDIGLFWFCESPVDWPSWQDQQAYELVASSMGGIVMQLNLLKQGKDLVNNNIDWAVQMGIQATPVKQIPKDWRKWRMSPAKSATIKIFWPTGRENSLKYFGFPEANNPILYKQAVEQARKNGQLAIPYSCLTYLLAQVPSWKDYEKDWSAGWADRRSADMLSSGGSSFERINPMSQSFRDFIIYKNVQFFKMFNVGGFYNDLTKVYNVNLIDGRQMKGKLPNYPILAYRNLYKRLYSEVKLSRSPTFMMAHLSGEICIPVVAYEDAYLDGEQFKTPPIKVKDSYMDVVTLDQFRSEFMGKQWGVMPFFLPEFDEPYRSQIRPTRGLIGLLLLHDIGVWPKWCNTEIWDRAYESLDKFGYVNSTFIPYFDPIPPAKVSADSVYVSAYKRSDGKCLAIVTNVGRLDRRGYLKLDYSALGLSPNFKVSIWPDGGAVKRTREGLPFKLEGLDYLFLLVEN